MTATSVSKNVCQIINLVEETEKEPWQVHADLAWQVDNPEHDEEEWNPKHGLNYFVRTEFTTGGCGHFAAALHDRTGWAIYVEGYHDDPDEWGHAFCVRPDGRAVDINGIHPTGWARTKYSDPNLGQGPLRPIDRSEIEPDGEDGYFAWANTILDHFPEHYGLDKQEATR